MTSTAKKCFLTETHLFEKHGVYFAFLPQTLMLYQVDKDTFDELSNLKEKYGTGSSFYSEDEDLIASGIIYESEEPQGDKFKQGYEEYLKENPDEGIPPITNAVLQIANDCNLNCIYCYGDGGSYGRQRELMTMDTAKKAIDLMVANSEGVKELTVIFFGGEPLINFEVVKGTLEYCKSIEETSGKKFRYSMTTNGTILTDEIYNFIKDNRVSVMISMDGGEELQNKHRCYCNGKGSFDDIKKNIERFKEARGGYLTARATVCRTDIRFKKIRDDLLALGFTNAVTSMVDTSEDSPLFIGGDYTNRVLAEYEILADDYIESMKSSEKKQLNNLFSEASDRLYFKKLKIRSCNAGYGGIAIGTDGNIYPCHRFMGMPEYIIGTLNEGINEITRAEYRKATIFTKAECNDCWARYLCSGGCAHTSAVHGGDVFHAPTCYCDIYKGLYEIHLYTYCKLKEWDENIFKCKLEKSDKTLNTL